MKKLSKLIAGVLLLAMAFTTVACKKKKGLPDNIVADEYKIVVACQTEMGEIEVLNELKTAYEAKNPDVKIEIKSFSGDSFSEYMGRISADHTLCPNIIWTADTYHSYWNQFFVDLRPYYEASEETDYSLYYETMLDATGINGTFKPTKNYTNPLGEFDREKDTSDGKEHYTEHSEYGMFYAPRDFNKPAILCNTNLFEELDVTYETLYKANENVSAMPAGYKSTSARLAEIVEGVEWDDFYDLTTFAKFIAERIAYLIMEGDDNMVSWEQKAVLELFLEWEPTYTTVMNALNVDIINDENGSLNLSNNKTALTKLHDAFYPTGSAVNNKIAAVLSANDVTFKNGNLFMTVCSRPVVKTYGDTFRGKYGETSLQSIPFPVENIAAGNSGYAIASLWDGKGMTVDGVFKDYTDLSWDFIKFIITEEGQEIAGKTGLSIPVLKSLDADGEWRKVANLSGMNHDAWTAGGELRQDTFNIFKSTKREGFRGDVSSFFINLLKKDYGHGGELDKLIDATVKSFNLKNPSAELLGK